ncbi:STAS-like domain-containing protein [Phenylobacterium sp. J426]|uniref:STAS-like domain-containing protein n=1 Tax=Phenylobacterium sp. J426 TaxID=2898439 RepID=UPI002150EA95|nr:STAS-like domain-containing protein [Phenylobacterium sp. J426]MCR5875155.1 STAS-like domain-containing protein [Phenylobacterium sp. J426]
MRIISVAKDFSRAPGPRYIRQGDWSGEKFRKLLVKELQQHDVITVNLDGTRGYGSSFLDEAFGGLVRSRALSKAEALRRVQIVSDEDPTYRDEAIASIKIAEPIDS